MTISIAILMQSTRTSSSQWNARNVSFRISLRWTIHIINPVDKTKLSSLIPKSTVEVECPLRKMEMVSLKRDSLAQKSVIWEVTSFSNTLDSTGRIIEQITSWKVRAYGIYARVVDVSENGRVSFLIQRYFLAWSS